MAFTFRQTRFLQNLVAERPAVRHAGEVARYFHDHHGLGTAAGQRMAYGVRDFGLAAQLLRAHDLPVDPLPPSAARADVAVFGGLSEKSGSAAPHADSIAIKCAGRCTLAAAPLATPAGTYLVVTSEVGRTIRCDKLLLVENFETFRQLEQYRWIDYRSCAVLVIYRGDRALPMRAATDLVAERSEGVWAFVDFDPAGLLIANALPASRLERILLPSIAWLRAAADSARGRQLFDAQQHQARASLEVSVHAPVRTAWRELRALRSAVTQERMRAARA